MNYKTNIILIFLFLLVSMFFLPVSVSANGTITTSIHMITQEPRTRFGNPVIVAGIWHYINATVEAQDFQELKLIFYQGQSIPATENRDASNYYEWNHNTESQQWSDKKKYGDYTYIKNDNCQKEGNIYSFCVGIKDTLPSIADYYENWTLEIYEGEVKSHSKTVVVEKPNVGLAKTHGDLIEFNVEPFTIMDALGSDYIRVKNTGNIPLKISFDYGSTYEEILEISGENETIQRNELVAFTPIILHSGSWKPEIRQIKNIGEITGGISPSYIVTTGTITFEESLSVNAPNLKIFIGHGDYEIERISGSDITFQYEKNLEMYEGEIKDIKLYVSGNGNVEFNVESNNNLEILKLLDNQGNQVSIYDPLNIVSINTSEYEITVQVKAFGENTTGYLYYNLTIDEEIKNFTTQVDIGSPMSAEESAGSLNISLVAGVVIIILVVIFYIIYSNRMYKRR